MIYEFKFKSQEMSPSDLDLLHEDPRAALNVYSALRERFYEDDFAILRDGVKINAAELESDIESYEIQAVVKEEEARLPASYRSGWGLVSDITAGNDGQATSVWKPENPEDDYE